MKKEKLLEKDFQFTVYILCFSFGFFFFGTKKRMTEIIFYRFCLFEVKGNPIGNQIECGFSYLICLIAKLQSVFPDWSTVNYVGERKTFQLYF